MSSNCCPTAYDWTSMSISGGPIAYYWTSRSVLNCRNSLRGDGGRRGGGDGDGGDVQRTLAIWRTPVHRAQEPNIQFGESLTSTQNLIGPVPCPSPELKLSPMVPAPASNPNKAMSRI